MARLYKPDNTIIDGHRLALQIVANWVMLNRGSLLCMKQNSNPRSHNFSVISQISIESKLKFKKSRNGSVDQTIISTVRSSRNYGHLRSIPNQSRLSPGDRDIRFLFIVISLSFLSRNRSAPSRDIS